MEVLAIAVSVLFIAFNLVFAFVVYSILKAVYTFLKPVLTELGVAPLFFRLSPKVVSALFVICFLAMVL